MFDVESEDGVAQTHSDVALVEQSYEDVYSGETEHQEAGGLVQFGAADDDDEHGQAADED